MGLTIGSRGPTRFAGGPLILSVGRRTELERSRVTPDSSVLAGTSARVASSLPTFWTRAPFTLALPAGLVSEFSCGSPGPHVLRCTRRFQVERRFTWALPLPFSAEAVYLFTSLRRVHCVHRTTALLAGFVLSF